MLYSSWFLTRKWWYNLLINIIISKKIQFKTNTRIDNTHRKPLFWHWFIIFYWRVNECNLFSLPWNPYKWHLVDFHDQGLTPEVSYLRQRAWSLVKDTTVDRWLPHCPTRFPLNSLSSMHFACARTRESGFTTPWRNFQGRPLSGSTPAFCCTVPYWISTMMDQLFLCQLV